MRKIGSTKANELLRKGAFLVDIRSPVAFRDGHIGGAVNLPLRNYLNTVIGMDRSRTVILYSDVYEDISLTQGYTYTENLGFANVFVATYNSLLEPSEQRQTIFAGVARPSAPKAKKKSKKKGP